MLARRATAAAVLLATVLAGCSSPSPGATVSPTGGGAAPSGAPANATTTVATSSDGDPNDVQVPLGGAFDGNVLMIGLSKPVAYTPSDTAFVSGTIARAVAFNITVTDRSATQSLPAQALTLQGQSGSTQDQEIEDTAKNVGDSDATILPGKTLTWEVAFSVPADAHDITVQVASTGGGKTIVFSGSI